MTHDTSSMFIQPREPGQSRSFSLELLKNLTGIFGVPAALFAIGYLAEQSHFALLGLPTGLTSSAKEHLFYDGALFLALTMQVVVWHWSFVVAMMGGILVYRAVSWVR